jgi:Putative MetA-pathway of phenol degradation
MKKILSGAAVGLFMIFATNTPVRAHGPLFSPAPETIFKGGSQFTLGFDTQKSTGAGLKARDYNTTLEATYGLTADWEVEIEAPYSWKGQNGANANGFGDITLGTKYQFWGRNLPSAQYKATALFKVKLPTGKDGGTPRLGSGSTDVIAGLTTGYESRRWYWFASGVYRASSEGAGNLEKGDQQFLNLVGGIRPVLTNYKEPDTVLMLELNWENAGRDRLAGISQANTGGWELFVSPVIWWTYRQVALRGGVQISIANDLKGTQPATDYRGRVEVVYHF